MKQLAYLIIFLLVLPTILANNLTQKDISIEIIIPDEIVLNQTYENLFKLINNNHTPGKKEKINITANYYIKNTTINNNFTVQINSYKTSGTGSFRLSSPGNYTLFGRIINSSNPDNNTKNNIANKTFLIEDPSLIYCNISINISTEKNIYNNNEQIKYYNTLNNQTFPFIIEYWIEDLFGNVIKQKTNTTNLNQKSYTPSIDEQDKTLIIKNNLYLTACKNSGKIRSQKIITIKNNITKNTNTKIKITKIPDNAEFGETTNIDLDIYKGDTRKQVIYLWIEDNQNKKISEKSKIKVLDKYTQYSFSVPLQIKPDCENHYETDLYNLIVEGLDQNLKKEIKVKKTSSNLCQIEYIEKETKQSQDPKQQTQKLKFSYSLHSLPEKFYINKSFNISINFTNTEQKTHNISVHAYIYEGPTCYSLTRNFNKKTFSIKKDTSKIINLTITNNKTTNQSYNLKIKIKKNNLKTYKEITTILPVFIKPKKNITKTTNPSSLSQTHNKYPDLLPTGMTIAQKPNITVFESSKENTKNYTFWIILLVFVFSLILFISIKKGHFSPQ